MTQRAAGEHGRGPIGILGGTFDPVHLGHLALAHAARSALGLERVLFVPNADPPHKQGQDVTPAGHRAAMLALAIEPEPGFELSRLELDRPGPSYAVDTVAAVHAVCLAEDRPEPWFILSAEALDDFHAWREPERILELCSIAVAPRVGAERIDAAWLAERFPGREDRFELLGGPMPDIAGTAVRARVRRGEDIRDLVPAPVAGYIDEHWLYRTAQDAPDDQAKEEQRQVDDEQGAAVSGSDGQTSGTPEGEATNVLDPRRAAKPGLPSGRASAERAARMRVLEGGVDESVLALAHRIVELASDKKASDIVLLDVRGQTAMTDYFVICSGASDRQLGAIADGIVEGVKVDGDAPLSREGEVSSHWLLIDYGGVIVHVMSRPEREFYQLEKLWSEAALLVHIV